MFHGQWYPLWGLRLANDGEGFRQVSSYPSCWIHMMTSSNGNSFRVTGPLWGEFTGHRWIPLTKASHAELWCFLWSAPWINDWVNNREDDDLRRHRTHYNVIVVIRGDSKCGTRFHWNVDIDISMKFLSLAVPKFAKMIPSADSNAERLMVPFGC